MDVVGVGAVAAAVAANVDAITTITCCGTSGATAAPTPSSSTCVLSTSSTTLPSTRLSEVAVVGSEKISLPWDFAATELCRSCGRPQTELYELFEKHRSDDIDDTNQTVIDTSRIVEEPSVSLNNSNNEVIEDQHKTKMNILQEMQIWQLRVKRDDGYPQRICRKCRTQFLLIGKFRRKCLKVQIRLRELNEESRLEEEQQLLKRLDEKEILDIPPVLDIGHDLINDNYGQPLSEVELFETNWNATETTQNESLTNESMVNDTDKAVRDDNDDDELRTAETENITIGCRVLHDLDLEVKANIDEESLLDTNSLFNTNIGKETLEDNEVNSQERVQIVDNVTLEKNIIDTNLGKNIADEYTTEDLNCSYYVENTLDMLASNQKNDFSISENGNNLTKNAVEIISIENLGKIDLVPIISSGDEANDLRILAKNENNITELKHDKKEDYKASIDNAKEKDCILTEVKSSKDRAENRNKLENELTETGNIESLSKRQQKPEEIENNEVVLNDNDIFIKGTKSELGTPHGFKSTSDDCCLKKIVEMRKSNRRHSDTTFVTKAALKEYDSHSSNLKISEKMSSSDKSLIDKNEQLHGKASKSTIDVEKISDLQTASADMEDKLSNKANDKPMHDNPKPPLIIPYAQKRRKKLASKIEVGKSSKQMHKIINDSDMEMENAENSAAKTRECSVRLRRLSASKLNSFVHDSTNDISTTEVASPQLTEVRKKRKNLNIDHNDQEVVSDDVKIKTLGTETEELGTANVANKILKLESKTTPKKRLSWKTKAEMKATIDTVKLRKTSLRRHAKTETKLQETDAMMVTSIQDNNKIEDHAKETNLKQVPIVDVDQQQSMNVNKIVTTQADGGNKNMDTVSVPKTVVSTEENKQNQAKQQLKNFILRRRRHERSSFQRERDCTNITSVVNKKISKKKLESNDDKNVSDCKNNSNDPIEINQQNTLPLEGEHQGIRTEPDPVSEKQQPKSRNLRRKQVMQVKRWRLGLRRAKDGSPIKNKDVETKNNDATEDKATEIQCFTTKLESTAIDEVSSSEKLTELKIDVEQATTSQKHNATENKEKEIFRLTTNLESAAIDESVSSSQKLTEVKKFVKRPTTSQEQQIKSRRLRRRKEDQMVRRRPSFLRTIQCKKPIPVKDAFQKQVNEVDGNEAENKEKELICKEKSSHSVALNPHVSMPQEDDETVLGRLPIPQETAKQVITEQSPIPQEVSETIEEPTSSSQAAKQSSSSDDKLQVIELNVNAVETAQSNAVAEDINKTVGHAQTQNLIETNELIVRVPLTALTEEFQRMYFFTTNVQNNTENFIGAKQTAIVPRKSSFAAWNQNETENSAHALTKSNFCESAAAECSESAGALITDISIRATNFSSEEDVQNPNNTVCSQNESDLSEFYGFASETDHSFEINSVERDDEENDIETENIVLVSTQITDYINDFQTNCLTSNDVDDKSNTFPYDETNDVNMSSDIKDEQNLSMTQIQTVRDINTHLSSNVSENDVESTLNGILNEIQDQHIFSSNTTLVTLESEDYHNHSAYSPLSDEPSELQLHQNDFLVKTMKNTLCDSADSTGPVVDPRQVEGNTEVNHPIMSDAYATDFSKFVECFTEDSTQSELIGFQNDIPCFENIEMNSSTPRHNLVTPPLQMLSQSSTTSASSTPLRITNSALQGAIQHGKNLEISFKNMADGNVQYLGITTNECDMADTMGLVCSTSSGVQCMPSLNNSSNQTLSATFINEQQANAIGKEYAVNNATMHLSQLFTEVHHPKVKVNQTHDANIASGSSQDITAILLPDKKKQTTVPPIRSTKNSVLSKFVGSSKRLVYSKAAEGVGAGNAMLQTKKKLQFVTLANDGQSTSNNAVTVSAPTEIGTLNIGNTNLCSYAEMLQDVQWQNNAQDQQTTYYINAADLQNSNLISALVSGNISLVSSQISTTGAPQPTTSIIRTQEAHESNKQSVDANENYIEGMQNQSIMIVFPQELFKESATLAPVSTDYNSSQNITTLPVLNATSAQSNVVVNTPSTVNSLSTSVPPLSSPKAPEQVLSSVNLTCRFCHKRPKFTNNLEYSNHIIATHPAENPYNCPLCPMFFMRRVQRQQHVLEAHGSHRFQCAQCGQSFSMQRALDLHLQRFHVPDAPQQNLPKPRRKRMTREQKQLQQQQILNATPSCSSQQQQVQKLSTAQSHINPTSTWQDNASVQVNLEDVHLQVTDDDRTVNEADNVRTTQNLNTPPHRILGCPECDDSFEDIADAESHINQAHSHSPIATMPSPEQTEPDSTSTTTLRQFRKQRLSSKSFDDTPERVLRSSHNCMFCEERFTNEIALRKHHQMAHNNQSALPFVCSMCKRGFRMRTALQRHMDTHDSEGRPYECNVCRVRFPRPSQLTLHKLTVHFLKKPHTCNICGRQFGTDSALKAHAKFHGEKLVDCSKCDKKFFLVKDFRKHWRIHTRELFYKCDICPKSFLHYTRLSAHVKTHIPLGVYIEEDPPALIREQRKLQQQPTVEQSATENLNSSDVDNPQISS